MDCYSVAALLDLTDGAGTSKRSPGGGWQLVKAADIDRVPVRPSAVASYLHDHPDLLFN